MWPSLLPLGRKAVGLAVVSERAWLSDLAKLRTLSCLQLPSSELRPRLSDTSVPHRVIRRECLENGMNSHMKINIFLKGKKEHPLF